MQTCRSNDLLPGNTAISGQEAAACAVTFSPRKRSHGGLVALKFQASFDGGTELRWRIFEIMLTNAIVSFTQVDPCCVSAMNRGRHPMVGPSQHFATKDE